MDEIDLFKKKLNQNRFIEAAALADLISIKNNNQKKRWDEIGDFLLNYHNKLLSFSTQFNWTDRIKREFYSENKNILEQDIELEKTRLNNLLSISEANFDYRIILECYKGYYSLINQDGLRASIQLYKTLIIIEYVDKDLFSDLKNHLEFLIISNIGINTDKKFSINNDQPFSLYAEYDKFFYKVSNLVNLDIMNSFEIFKPHLLTDRSTFLN